MRKRKMDLVLPRTDVGAKEKERNLFRVVISKVAGVLLLSMLFAPLVLVMVMPVLFDIDGSSDSSSESEAANISSTSTPKLSYWNIMNNKTEHKMEYHEQQNKTHIHTLRDKNATIASQVREHSNMFGSVPKIPRQIFFTHKENILETKRPKMFYENILKTVKAYEHAWGDAIVPVTFLNDKKCVSEIRMAMPELVVYFHNETRGEYKADTCRLAALYNHGGYYFDVDLDVVEPFVPKNSISFVTAKDYTDHYFFQAVLFTSRQNPILKTALDEELEYYQGRLKLENYRLKGPATLQIAFDSVPQIERNHSKILHELSLTDKPESYPNAFRNDLSFLCNMIVHDKDKRKVHFRSRIEQLDKCKVEEKASNIFDQLIYDSRFDDELYHYDDLFK